MSGRGECVVMTTGVRSHDYLTVVNSIHLIYPKDLSSMNSRTIRSRRANPPRLTNDNDVHKRRKWLKIRIQGEHRSFLDNITYYVIVPLIMGLNAASLSSGVVFLVGGLSSTSFLLGKETQKAIIDWMGHTPPAIFQPFIDQWYDNLGLPIIRIFYPKAESSREAQLSRAIRVQAKENELQRLRRKKGTNTSNNLADCITASFGNFSTLMFLFGAGATFVYFYYRREVEREQLLYEYDCTFTDYDSSRPGNHIRPAAMLTQDSEDNPIIPRLPGPVTPAEKETPMSAVAWRYLYRGSKLVVTFLSSPFVRTFLP
ncbi:hypothetical protein EON65_41230 [archaeon]|nr:MAG: hypothetical protein EON65_41230 [archaeon]